MKCQIYHRVDSTLEHHRIPPQLYLAPQNPADRRLLIDLIQNFECIGMGRDPETLALMHVEILLKEKE